MRFLAIHRLCAGGALVLLVASAPPPARSQRTDLNLSPRYAQSLWPAGHRDSANTDYVPVVMSRDNRIARHLLTGHPIFWPPIAGSGGHLYVTSGKGPGHSHLHAFDSRGELRWQAPPQQSIDDLDSYAIINAPVVDREGGVYVGDINQLWAFDADGSSRWVSDLTQYGVDHGFMTVVISHQGYVGGISSNGKVVFFRPQDGELALPVLDLPGGPGPPAEDSPPRDLWKDLMDPAIVDIMFNLIQGWEMEVANTPALHPDTGRIYIAAAGIEPKTGLLYGIDVHDDRLEIAFQTPMGGGSGTSPAVSHDGRQVYALDQDGHMVAVDADTGALLWQTTEGGGGSASPSVGPDGTVYTAFQDHLLAFRPDGSLKWSRSYKDLAARQIPPVDGLWWIVFSERTAFADSLFTVAEREGWLNIVCGYDIRLMPSGSNRTRVPLPLRSTLVAIDLETGDPIGEPLILPETSDGFIVPTLDGNTFVSLSGAMTSIFYHMLNPWLPERFAVPGPPAAGLLLLEPHSRPALARQGFAWLLELGDAAARAIEAGKPGEALAALRRSTLQLAASRAVLERAGADGDLEDTDVRQKQRQLAEVAERFGEVRSALEGPPLSPQAAGALRAHLDAARELLALLSAP